MNINSEIQETRKPGRPMVDRRDEILEAAEALYRAIGFDKTTIGDIAKRLKMSPANIYRSFPNRRAIDEAIASRQLALIEDLAWTHARSNLLPAERLRAMVHAVHDISREYFLSEDRLTGICAAATREHWPVVMRFMDALHGALRHVLMDGMRDGSFRPVDPDETADTLITTFVPFWHPLMIEANQGRDRHASADRSVDLVLAALQK